MANGGSDIGAVAGTYGPAQAMQDPRAQGHRGMGFLGGFPMGGGVSQVGGNFIEAETLRWADQA